MNAAGCAATIKSYWDAKYYTRCHTHSPHILRHVRVTTDARRNADDESLVYIFIHFHRILVYQLRRTWSTSRCCHVDSHARRMGGDARVFCCALLCERSSTCRAVVFVSQVRGGRTAAATTRCALLARAVRRRSTL